MLSKGSLIGALIVEATTVIIALLVAFGLALTAEQIAAIVGGAGFAGLILTLVLWMTTVPKEAVVELLIGDAVKAGVANNQVPTGAFIRDASEPVLKSATVLEYNGGTEPGQFPTV